MKAEVDKQLNALRLQLRTISPLVSVRSTPERQKTLVSVVQEYVRHLGDCIRGEYRDRVLVRHEHLRMYTQVLRRFEEFKRKVRRNNGR